MFCGSVAESKVGSLTRRCGAIWGRHDDRWKIARRCGAKQIWKSKLQRHFSTARGAKHLSFGALLEVEILQRCMRVGRAFVSWDATKVQAVVAQSRFRSKNVKDTIHLRYSDPFWTPTARWQQQQQQQLRIQLQLQLPLHCSRTAAANYNYRSLHCISLTTLQDATLHDAMPYHTTLRTLTTLDYNDSYNDSYATLSTVH